MAPFLFTVYMDAFQVRLIYTDYKHCFAIEVQDKSADGKFDSTRTYWCGNGFGIVLEDIQSDSITCT